MASAFTVSDILGYTSIACWLGAQFPQVLENYQRRSSDGLALSFLLNWLLGTSGVGVYAMGLVSCVSVKGCILTHQLPFQTYLAVYFCFVDLSLFGQYFYYRKPSKPITGYLGRARTTSTTVARRLSIDRPTRYRTLSHVAANVAAAAALAAQQEETRWHRSSLEAHHRNTSEQHLDGAAPGASDGDDEVDEQALARLADSFHSEGGSRSRRKVVSWSQERGDRRTAMSPTARVHPHLRMTSPSLPAEDFDFSTRGRPMARQGSDADPVEWAPTSAERRSSRASRKSASMVFLGVWALFGVGTLTGMGRGLPSRAGLRLGRVLAREEVTIPPKSIPVIFANVPAASRPEDVAGSAFSWTTRAESASSSDHPDEPSEHGGDPEYIIGRISAWICTTLYLTSRLPQIWKNFVRKSVEGLSMYLFIFAFLGNLFYVASILSSPKLQLPPRDASAFLRESIPYLLGSGGTLMFDVTIVAQSFIYRPKAHLRGRRSSRTVNEEEAGLLSADATGAEDPITPSRRRLPTGSEVDFAGN
ncbi:hypothetical protein EUX98_g201 [Antrodiella citrinella]|uniref:Uncharacterized protein n=1 Tax=Antrodiella citrinella TaxID=2447956 RepID=A0A4S4N4I9_9APHY|nr:hypothetical protein EUX98_g201 [Antrodiella citrinella]